VGCVALHGFHRPEQGDAWRHLDPSDIFDVDDMFVHKFIDDLPELHKKFLTSTSRVASRRRGVGVRMALRPRGPCSHAC
jgi:hypothetical protein